MCEVERKSYKKYFNISIVHPGIDVHFDIAFLNEHCGKVLQGMDFKLFENVEK